MVDWGTVPVVDQNGIILSYTVTYTALPSGIPRTAVKRAPMTQVTLRGLEEYTNYSIFVFASTVKGDGNASDPIIVTTDEDSKFAKAFLGKTFFSGHKFIKFGDRNGTEISFPFSLTYGALRALRVR